MTELIKTNLAVWPLSTVELLDPLRAVQFSAPTLARHGTKRTFILCSDKVYLFRFQVCLL